MRRTHGPAEAEEYLMHADDLQGGLAYAYALAARAHLDDRRWNGEPYIEHAIRVADRLEHDDVPGRIVALLHDVIEDHPSFEGEIEQVYRAFPGVLMALRAITRYTGELYLESYIGRVAQNNIARRVKLADLQDNMRDLPRDDSRYRRYSNATFELQVADSRARGTLREQPQHPDPMIRDQLLHEAPSA
jgi:(p)ppGpp synthase/HD superfamily hydrolase